MNSHIDWQHPSEPVWVHRSPQFLKALFKSRHNDIITCQLQNGQTITCRSQHVFQRNPIPADGARNDLMQLDLINEPEILQSLKSRLQVGQIYTFVQNTLLVLNPYKNLPQLCSQQCKDYYIGQIIDNRENIKDNPPHAYAITSLMISALIKDKKSQAIVISGQSGAGKTQTNKQCLRFMSYYFHKAKQSSQQDAAQSKVEKAIILSNPILQAFGNSKTIKNNNSSRFGKYLSICVDSDLQIRHAQIYNYLLQKSRLISRAAKQQNFHIFYEFITKLTLAEKVKYCLVDGKSVQLTMDDFNYLKSDKKVNYQPHPDIDFHRVKQSLQILSSKEDSYDMVCRVLSAILYLGNLQPYEDDQSKYCCILPEAQFQIVGKLLQINMQHFLNSLTMYSIKIGGEDYIKFFSKRDVEQLVHSLSKTLYEKLFQWIISELNKVASSNTESQDTLELGFLDIYGFEVLQINSLEQLFINYTNERLHQIYLQKIFKLEKSNFDRDGLSHKFKEVQFQDNLQIIDLIDLHSMSIFNLLDEWCSVASPDQSDFITNIRFHHKKNEKFPPSNFHLPSTSFIVKHTPRDVDYVVADFKYKNKDLLREQIKTVIKGSNHPLIPQLFQQEHYQGQVDPKAHKVRKFLSSKFRKQMSNLVNDLLQRSQLHFIRCIKSNSQKKAMKFNDQLVFQQIKYLGILDTIKIKKMGYCIKVKYQQLDRRFKWLVRYHFDQPADKQRINKVFSSFLPAFGQQQILYGTNRVFFKDYAYSILVKKYAQFYSGLKEKCHKLVSLFIKNKYQKIKERKKRSIKAINQYLHSVHQQLFKDKTVRNIKKLQGKVKNFLKYRAQKYKAESITTIQAYIKRKLEYEARQRKLNSLNRIIRFLKRCVIRRQMQGKIVAYKLLHRDVMNQVWEQILRKRGQVIEKYFKSFSLQCTKRKYISIANYNAQTIIKEKCFNNIQKYLAGLAEIIRFRKNWMNVARLQAAIRTWRVRRNYNELRRATIKIQRAWREYYFNKRGAKDLFTETYKFYDNKLLSQNEAVRSVLFQDEKRPNSDTIDVAFKHYLENFKQKMSLFYFCIDFQSFIDMDFCYPDNSWLLNYFNLCKESCSKENPIQYLSVGQCFTVAATTNRLYTWGMNSQYCTLDNIAQIKNKIPVEKFSINKDKVDVVYQGAQTGPLKIASTVSKAYNLQNGKLYQCAHDKLKLIKFDNNDRVNQIACGQSHVILRTSSKKVFTFGHGKKGQLGHRNTSNQQQPRSIIQFQDMKTSYPIQVAASFSSSMVLMSNQKLYWFGSNGTIQNQKTPTMFDMRSKSDCFAVGQTVPVRIIASWSRSMSVIGVTLLSYNNKLKNNIALRNKIANLLVTKWSERGIQAINPPYVNSVSDYLQECHVKLPKTKVNIQPQGKKKLQQLQSKAKSLAGQKMLDISFSDSFRGGFFK